MTSDQPKPEPRTRRAADGGFAGTGATAQHGGTLPVYVCTRCGKEVVWATSRRTGRKYLANVSHGYLDQRYYVGSSLHSDAYCQDLQDRAAQERTRLARQDAARGLADVMLGFRRALDAGDMDEPTFLDALDALTEMVENAR